jgi:hypothetical protein
MRTIDNIVGQEVLCCLSHLVATLAQGYGHLSPQTFGEKAMTECELLMLCEQAAGLCYPLQDWESAAIEAGWQFSTEHGSHFKPVSNHGVGYFDIAEGDWQELCEREDIDPHEREIYEHWAVTEWLAEKLEAKGERVDRDFAGLCVWGRTTTGQAISMDSVIADIHADLIAEHGE